MFIVLLKFGENKEKAAQYMEAHKDWIKRGFEDGVFALVGSLQPSAGGGVLAHNISRVELQARIEVDPFVAEKIVTAEIIELTPARADDRLQFLLD